jgi:hypothetical protein
MGMADAAATTVLSGLTTVLTKAVGVADAFVSASFGMTKAAASGAASLESMGSAVGSVARQIPIIGTAFAETLGIAIDVLEKDIQTQRTLSDVGATFGGNLTIMRDSVSKTYLSLEQFGKVTAANADVLASFRGGVQGGTETFTRVLTSLQLKGSETSNMLANLGVGFDEAAQLTAQFMRGQGSMNRAGQMSAEQLAKASADYAVELTGLSQLTGQSRKALAEKINEEMAEAQFQNFLNTLSPEEAKKAQEAVAQEFAVSGKAGSDALKASIAGFPPMTQASKLFTATQEASVARQQELVGKIKDSSIDLDTFRVQSKQILANSLDGMREDQKRLGPALMAMALQGGGELTKSVEAITKLLNATYGKLPAEIEEIFKNIRATAPLGSEATKGVNYLKTAIDIGNSQLQAMRGLFDGALEKGLAFAQSMSGLSQALIKHVETALSKLEVGKIADMIDKQIKAATEKLNSFDLGKQIDEMKKAVDQAKRAAEDKTATPKPGESKTAYVAGAVAGGVKDSLPILGNQLMSFAEAADKLVKGDLKGAVESFSTVVPNFFRMVEVWSDRIAQITRILGVESGTSAQSNTNEGPIPRDQLPRIKEKRAAGGPVTPGSYLVGEEGPELVSLGSRGDVINNDNLTAMVASMSNQNGMKESIDQLNTTNGQMLAAIRELVQVSQRTLTATRGLNGNLFAA